jgi:hypothetical protein
MFGVLIRRRHARFLRREKLDSIHPYSYALSMEFVRRLGGALKEECAGCQGCPDILELDNGDFAVIGTDITAEAANLPSWAGCAEQERIVKIPRRTLVSARNDIPLG